MRKGLTAIGLGSMLVGGVLAVPSANATTSVHLKAAEFRFCAASSTICHTKNFTITVPRGTRVTWTYADPACSALVICPGHNVTFPSVAGPTRKKSGAVLLSVVFNTPGTFHYYCSIHVGFGMTGSVRVT
jgi:plastocyanin